VVLRRRGAEESTSYGASRSKASSLGKRGRGASDKTAPSETERESSRDTTSVLGFDWKHKDVKRRRKLTQESVDYSPEGDVKSVSSAEEEIGGEEGYYIVSRWGKVLHKAGCPCKPCMSRRRQTPGAERRKRTQSVAKSRARRVYANDSDESDKDSVAMGHDVGLKSKCFTSASRTRCAATAEQSQRSQRLLRSNTRQSSDRIQKPSDVGDCKQRTPENSNRSGGVVLSVHRLLELGIFKGRTVEYRNNEGTILQTGIVADHGLIQCGCKRCKGKPVRFTLFELHACTSSYDAASDMNEEHVSRGEKIYLSNGTTLKDFAIAFNSGFVENFKYEDLHSLTGPSMPQKEMQHGTLAKATMKYTLDPSSNAEPRFRSRPQRQAQKSTGRRDKESHLDKTKLLFGECGLLEDGTRVACMSNQGEVLLRGEVRKPGILCGCCRRVMSCSQFETHAGRKGRRSPYDSIICVASGQTLRSRAEELFQRGANLATRRNAAHGQVLEYPSSCSCSRCDKKSGNLVACDACPQVFHPSCTGLSTMKWHRDWFCDSCSKGASAAAAWSGEAKHRIVQRCRELLAELDAITGGCVLCHVPDFSRGGFCSKTSILCDQCEREFHVGCLRKNKMAYLSSVPKGNWFCSTKCGDIHRTLGKMRAEGERGLAKGYSYEVLRGEGVTQQSKASLSEALAVLQGSFEPLPHCLTGVDLLPIMVKAETYTDHDYTNLHTILLRHKGEPVCAAVVRICGRFLAEMPFIATRPEYRHQGHCRMLFQTITKLLSRLSVQRLCLQATDKALPLWLKWFGFKLMEGGDFRQLRADFRILQFPGSTLLIRRIN